MKSQLPLDEAFAAYDRASSAELVAKAELQRQTIQGTFPRDQWSKLDLTDYALGQADKKDTGRLSRNRLMPTNHSVSASGWMPKLSTTIA